MTLLVLMHKLFESISYVYIDYVENIDIIYTFKIFILNALLFTICEYIGIIIIIYRNIVKLCTKYNNREKFRKIELFKKINIISVRV